MSAKEQRIKGSDGGKKGSKKEEAYFSLIASYSCFGAKLIFFPHF